MDLHAVLSLACHYAGVTPTDRFFDDGRRTDAHPRAHAARTAAFIILNRELGMTAEEIAAEVGWSVYGVRRCFAPEGIGSADAALLNGLNDCVQAILADPDIDDPEYIEDWQ